ncbi:hypothetical protein [Nocardia sp. GTS18]|uniref:hypothetical protein n=1 Tax=Nocardia sp. GTS18 TaxID=1778064 RepID=UPI001C67874A|nr:hypothetical protein [Nocardia sp. GTS18]
MRSGSGAAGRGSRDVFHPHVNLIRKALADGKIGRNILIEADYLHAMSPADVTGLIGDPAH